MSEGVSRAFSDYFQLVHGCLLIHVYVLINICMSICSVIRAYALSDKNPSVYVLTHEHVCVYVLGYKHLCVYVFTYKHLCVYVFTYKHLCVYVLTYINIFPFQ